jgi:hypothetical protein
MLHVVLCVYTYVNISNAQEEVDADDHEARRL